MIFEFLNMTGRISPMGVLFVYLFSGLVFFIAWSMTSGIQTIALVTASVVLIVFVWFFWPIARQYKIEVDCGRVTDEGRDAFRGMFTLALSVGASMIVLNALAQSVGPIYDILFFVALLLYLISVSVFLTERADYWKGTSEVLLRFLLLYFLPAGAFSLFRESRIR